MGCVNRSIPEVAFGVTRNASDHGTNSTGGNLLTGLDGGPASIRRAVSVMRQWMLR
jgi:hypothetical protein